MGGRGAKFNSKTGGVISVKQYLESLQSKSFKIIPEKKRLKQVIEKSGGKKRTVAETNLKNLESAQKKHRQIKDKKIQENREWMRKNKTQDRDAVRKAFARARTTTYEQHERRRNARIREFMGID